MSTPPLQLFALRLNQTACVYARDKDHAAALFLKERPITVDSFEIDALESGSELGDEDEPWYENDPCYDQVPISEPGANPAELSCSDLIRLSRCWKHIYRALSQPSDFPLVPELEPTKHNLTKIIGDLIESPDNVDWKLKGYLFLRYPKLKEALIQTGDGG